MTNNIVLIDNYDSFTFNLVTYLKSDLFRTFVFRNDETTVSEVERLKPIGIIVSPGPGHPKDSGLSLSLIKWAQSKMIPLLGVCLGHQALALSMGAQVVHAKEIVHGKASSITHDEQGVFEGLSQGISVGRYHSLALDIKSIPSGLKITAQTSDTEIMGVRHLDLPIEGIQFHPESVLTPHGKRMIDNFSRRCLKLKSQASKLL